MVDWSARSKPSPSRWVKDAIYIAFGLGDAEPVVRYFRTRKSAFRALRDYFSLMIEEGKRVLCGFDFPFGYPAGFAKQVTEKASALAFWQWLSDNITDADDNSNNRFAAARDLNAYFDGIGPFWGCPAALNLEGLPHKGRACFGTNHPSERRFVETLVPSASPVWKLFTTGSVGSQALLGIPIVNRLRKEFDTLAIWPFQDITKARIICAEIYPSLFADLVQDRLLKTPELIKDAVEVSTLAEAFRKHDRAGNLQAFLDAPYTAPVHVIQEEGWILGVLPKAA